MDSSEQSLPKPELLRLLKVNIRQFNEYRKQTNFALVDLTNEKIQGVTLSGATLVNIDFSGSSFEYSTLNQAMFDRCIFHETIFKFASLISSTFKNSDLQQADFSGAQLEGAFFENVMLQKANMSKANLRKSYFAGADFTGTDLTFANLLESDLRKAISLDKCLYDDHTRWTSVGLLPEGFLPPNVSSEPVKRSISKPVSPPTTMGDFSEPSSRDVNPIENQLSDLHQKLDELYDRIGNTSGGDNYATADQLKELEYKIENVASILTKLPIKSFEETYKMADVIQQVQQTQAEIHQNMVKFIAMSKEANDELRSLVSGKIQAQHIVGLDKLFAQNQQALVDFVKDSKDEIIEEGKKIDFSIDESMLSTVLDKEFSQIAKLLREDLNRKFDAQIHYFKSLEERLQALEPEADLGSILKEKLSVVFDGLKQDVEESVAVALGRSDLQKSVEGVQASVNDVLDVVNTLKIESQGKVDGIFEQLKYDFEDLISEALANYDYKKDIENIRVIANDTRVAVNTLGTDTLTNLKLTIAEIQEQVGELKLHVSKKFNLIEEKLTLMSSDSSEISEKMAKYDIKEELEELKSLASTLESSQEELKVVSASDHLKNTLDDFLEESQEFAVESGSDLLNSKVSSIKDLKDLLAQKIDGIAEKVSGNIDITDQLALLESGNAQEVVQELAIELDELKEIISATENSTKALLNKQSKLSEENFNQLREDLLSSIDHLSTMFEPENLVDTLSKGEVTLSAKSNEGLADSIAQRIEEKIKLLMDSASKVSEMEEDQEALNSIKALLEDTYSRVDSLYTDSINTIKYSSSSTMEKLASMEKLIAEGLKNLQKNLDEKFENLTDTSVDFSTVDLTEELEKLKLVAKGAEAHDKTDSLEKILSMKGNLDTILQNSKSIIADSGADELSEKVVDIEAISNKLSERLEGIASKISSGIDLSEQLQYLGNDETEELMNDFSLELEDLRDMINSSHSRTKSMLESQSKLNEDAFNRLREDITCSIDSMVGSFKDNTFLQELQEGLVSQNSEALIEQISKDISKKMQKLVVSGDSTAQGLPLGLQEEDLKAMFEDFKSTLIDDIKLIVDSNSEETREALTNLDITARLDAFNGSVTSISTELDVLKSSLDKLSEEQVDELSGNLSQVLSSIEALKDFVDTADFDNTSVLEIVNNLDDSVKKLSEAQITPIVDNISQLSSRVAEIENKFDFSADKIDYIHNKFGPVLQKIDEINSKEDSSNSDLDKVLSLLKKADVITESIHQTVIDADKKAETHSELLENIISYLSESGVKIQDAHLLEQIKGYMDMKVDEIDLEAPVKSIFRDFNLKLQRLEENLSSTLVALDLKVQAIQDSSPLEDIGNLHKKLASLKETSENISTLLTNVSENVSVEKFKELRNSISEPIHSSIETISNDLASISKDMEKLGTEEGLTAVQESVEVLANASKQLIDTLEILNEVSKKEDIKDFIAELDAIISEKVVDLATTDQLTQSTTSLANKLSSEISVITEKEDGLSAKVDTVIRSTSSSRLETIMSDLQELKGTTEQLDMKFNILSEELKNDDMKDLLQSLKVDLSSAINDFSLLLQSSKPDEAVRAELSTFSAQFVERLESTRQAMETLVEENLSQGIDFLTIDLSALSKNVETLRSRIADDLTLKLDENTEQLKNNTDKKLASLEEGLHSQKELLVSVDSTLNTVSGQLDTLMVFTKTLFTAENAQAFQGFVADQFDKVSVSIDSLDLESMKTSIESTLTDKLSDVIALSQGNKDLISVISDKIAHHDYEALQNTIHDKYVAILDSVSAFKTSIEALFSEKTEALEEGIIVADSTVKEVMTNVMALSELLTHKTDALSAKIDSFSHASEQEAEGFEETLAALSDFSKNLHRDVLDCLASELDTISEKKLRDFLLRVDTLSVDVLTRLNEMDKVLSTKQDDALLDQIETFLGDIIGDMNHRLDAVSDFERRLDFVYSELSRKIDDNNGNKVLSTLLEYIKNDSDHKMVIMKELTATKQAAYSTAPVEQRIGNLETLSHKQDEKINELLISLTNLIEDMNQR